LGAVKLPTACILGKTRTTLELGFFSFFFLFSPTVRQDAWGGREDVVGCCRCPVQAHRWLQGTEYLGMYKPTLGSHFESATKFQRLPLQAGKTCQGLDQLMHMWLLVPEPGSDSLEPGTEHMTSRCRGIRPLFSVETCCRVRRGKGPFSPSRVVTPGNGKQQKPSQFETKR
jgi:hypothetical protein